jgi:peptidoglycan/xylan/chitin deacetylase (PgdA/CDA1 family)
VQATTITMTMCWQGAILQWDRIRIVEEPAGAPPITTCDTYQASYLIAGACRRIAERIGRDTYGTDRVYLECDDGGRNYMPDVLAVLRHTLDRSSLFCFLFAP